MPQRPLRRTGLASFASLLDGRRARTAGLSIAVTAGLALVLLVFAAPRPAPDTDALRAVRNSLARLEADLAAQAQRSERLAAELSRLRAEVARLGEMESTERAEGPSPEFRSPATPVDSADAPRAPEPAFDAASLVEEGGLRPDEADELRQLWLEAEMQKAEITATANAEDWANTYRHQRALRAVDERIRRSLDERAYDQLLYATGRPNRLVVQEVLDGSLAERVGLRPGDRILRYDGKRLFSAGELSNAVGNGMRGESVRLDLERNGTPMSIFVEREPLGVLSALTREHPVVR